jgi:hypothetical protein
MVTAQRALLDGDVATARTALRRVAGATGHTLLAEDAAKRADFAACAEACRRGARARAADRASVLHLDALRALSLAALGRREEAERAIEALTGRGAPAASLARARLVLAATAPNVDVATVRAILPAFGGTIPRREALLFNALCASQPDAPEALVENVQEALDTDAAGRAWVDAIVPGLTDRVRARRVRVEAAGEPTRDEAEPAEDERPSEPTPRAKAMP